MGILLDSSNVSVTADSGAVVGSLTTVTKNAGETFIYQLLEERSLPFRIQGNKLLVARKEGLEFQVSSSGEPLIAVSIISRGNMSNPLRETFFIRIVGKNINMFVLSFLKVLSLVRASTHVPGFRDLALPLNPL